MLINDMTDFGVKEIGIVIGGIKSYDLSIMESRICNVTTKNDEINVFNALIVVSNFGKLIMINTQMTPNE